MHQNSDVIMFQETISTQESRISQRKVPGRRFCPEACSTSKPLKKQVRHQVFNTSGHASPCQPQNSPNPHRIVRDLSTCLLPEAAFLRATYFQSSMPRSWRLSSSATNVMDLVECKGCIHGFGRGPNLDIKSGFLIICVQIYLFNMLF